MSKQIKNQRGSALALALFLVVIISILGISCYDTNTQHGYDGKNNNDCEHFK